MPILPRSTQSTALRLTRSELELLCIEMRSALESGAEAPEILAIKGKAEAALSKLIAAGNYQGKDTMQIWYEIDNFKGLIIPLKVEKKGDSMFTLVGGHRQRYDRNKHFKTYELAHTRIKEEVESNIARYREWIARDQATLEKLTTGHYASKPAQYAALEDEAAGISVGSPAQLARAIATGA